MSDEQITKPKEATCATHVPGPRGFHIPTLIAHRKEIRKALAAHERDVIRDQNECALHAVANGYDYRKPVLLERQIENVARRGAPPEFKIWDFWMP